MTPHGQTGVVETALALPVSQGELYGLLYEVLGGEDTLQPDQDRGVQVPHWVLLVERDGEAGHFRGELQ